MKKLLMFLSLCGLVVGITGCDKSCTTEFKIKNQTESEIIIKMSENSKQMTIAPDQELTVNRQHELCGGEKPSDRYYQYPDVKMMYAEMRINGELVPDIIWKRKYWDFTSVVSRAIYTLTVTDELLENIGFGEGL